jgi:hypothetical protein
MTGSAKQSSEADAGWIASSQELLAMTVEMLCRNTSVLNEREFLSTPTLHDLVASGRAKLVTFCGRE